MFKNEVRISKFGAVHIQQFPLP